MKIPITIALAVAAVARPVNKLVPPARLLRLLNDRCAVLVCLALPVLFLAGCATNPGLDEQLDTTKYTIESTGKFVQLDQTAQALVRCTGLQERILPDGRLEVVANVKNLEKRKIQVEIDCVFKDDQGISTENETPFRKLNLIEGSTQAVQFTSINNQARKYTIGVREAQ